MPDQADDPASPESLLKLVAKYCTNDQIHSVLKLANGLNGDVRLSGNREQLLEHLRQAFGLVEAAIPAAYQILCDAEESGQQIVYFYLPADDAKERLGDGERIASTLFGDNWRESEGFPRYHVEPVGEHWADFKINQMGQSGQDWTAKVYSGVSHWKLIDRTRKGDEETIVRRLVLSRETYVVKWHHQGVLEMRVPNADSKKQRLESRLAFQNLLGRAIDFSNDVVPFDLRRACQRILRDSFTPSGEVLYSIPSVDSLDAAERKLSFSTRSSEEHILDQDGSRELVSH